MSDFYNLQRNYQEHGKKAFLELLSTLLDFKLPENIDTITIDFIPATSVIAIKNDKSLDFTLSFHKDYLVFTQKKNKYKFETYYYNNYIPYQYIAYFKGENENIIALQETMKKNIKSRHLIYYSANDIYYPKYEKEIIKLNDKPIECEYNYQESNNQLQTYKAMRMEDCIYYYHFQTYPHSSHNLPYTSFLEVSASTNVPKLNIYDRLNEEESLRDTISSTKPNIILLGTIINKNGNNYTYKIKITKEYHRLLINILEINLQDFSEKNYQKTLLTTTEGELTITEINQIIKSLITVIPIQFLSRVIPELQNIQANINKRNNKIKIGDFLDCNFNYYPDFKELALDILNNLPIYEHFIINSITKQKENNQEILGQKL